jgi:hypothetical protein
LRNPLEIPGLGPQSQEYPVQRTSFDFDVITGPADPRPAPKPAPKPAPTQAPQPAANNPAK